MLNTIVVVDDNEADRYLAKRVIDESGCARNVVEVENGEEIAKLVNDPRAFQEACGPCPPMTVVLLDINMPRMNGFEALEAMKTRLESADDCIVVMMFSSSDNERDKKRAFEYSFVKDFIVKPLEPQRLSEVVAALS